MFKKLPFLFLFLISLLVITLPTFATTGIFPGTVTTNLPGPESIGMGEDLFDKIRVNKNNNDLPVNPCIPSVYYPCVMYLTNVTIGTINSNSGCDGSYSDFTAQSTIIEIGTTATIAITGYNYAQYVSVYIDLNDNDQMTDYGEQVVNSLYVPAGIATSTSFALPGNALPGSYIMRVISTYVYDGSVTNPCGQTNYGEAEDYTIIVTCPTTPTVFYADEDGDGFGNPGLSITETGCPPAGYVTDNTDCDDNNAAYFNTTYWYYDADGDGYYGDFIYTCVPPEGEGWTTQTYGQDCDDTNAAYTNNQNWYYDGDGDGYHSNYTYDCIPPEGEGWSIYTNGYDCDDTNAALYYAQYWFHDGDGDGYYSNYIYACIPPEGEGWSTGYSYGSDCDDTNAALYYAQYWYYDGDGDGYYSNYTYDCSPPESEGWSIYTNGEDCDDTNSALNTSNWYYDGDGDGYYSDYFYSCTPPEGEGWNNNSNYGSDCDDTNAALTSTSYWYYDGDGDGYYGGISFVCVPPEGEVWSVNTNGEDCDDTNALYGVGDYYYLDSDGDGYFSEYVYACALPDGEGWGTNGNYGFDCDDTNAAAASPQYWFHDGDGDGYYSEYLYTCIPPEGEGWSINTNGEDCDDTNVLYGVGNYYYLDADGDGYFSEYVNACALPEGEGWSIYSYGFDCDDTNASYTYGGYYYLDADGDGYYSEYVYACFLPEGEGWTTLSYYGGGDCDDANAAIHPGSEILGNGIDDNCDGLGDILVYCTPQGYTNCHNNYINNVELGTISNPSGCSSGYEDYSQLVVSADAGDEIMYSVSTAGFAFLNIYIDYDQNGDFNSEDELVVNVDEYHYGEPFTGTISLPSGLAGGSYRIRIKTSPDYYDDYAPCYFGNGEVEDYIIYIGGGCADIDLDGYSDQACGGNDCDDNNSNIHPAATEICNGDIDDNCNGTADDADNTVTGQGTYYTDGDSDGYGAGDAILACSAPANTVSNNEDCDDNDNAIHPAAQEICNGGTDDDCDGASDDADESITGQNTYYTDGDGDGYGAGDAILACTAPANTASNNEDCDDNDNVIHPAAQEICNGGTDDDCDGSADDADNTVTGQGTYFADADNDGYGGDVITACIQPIETITTGGDCNDASTDIHPGAPEVCNSIDEDCDGNIDEGVQSGFYTDNDGDGYGAGAAILACTAPANTVSNNEDCDDNDNAVHPAAQEICNAGIDDDCDGNADDADSGVTGQMTWYADGDGDGYGTGAAILACPQPANTSDNDMDCNDAATTVYPGATELCNPVDDDCDGILNEDIPTTTYYRDFDGDGKGNPAVTIESCYQPAGYVANATDCDDNSATACPKPSAMITSNVTDVSATVSWGYLPCATKYRLEYRRKTAPISAWTIVYTTAPTYNITGLTGPNIQYQWRVATICSPNGTAAESGYASLQSFYTKYKVYTDADMDGFGDPNAGTSYVSAMPQPGYSSNQSDCDDAAASTYPGAPELCNGIDDDCDLIVDEGANWFQDADGDGLGNAAVSLNACMQPAGYVANSVDCNDNSSTPVCATPTNVTATGIGVSFVTINWTTSPCASGYTVMYRIAPQGAFSTQFNTTGGSMMLSGLLPGTTYQARVRAKCPAPNTVTTSNWVYVTFTTNGAGLIEQVDEDISTLDPFTFGVYPNPGDGRFTLSIPGDTDGEADISVLDGFGKLIHSVRWSVYEGITVNELDLTHLPGGVYHINIRKGDMVQTKKVVVVR